MAHTAATPQRDRPKHSTAEEPITTRIRRRQETARGPHASDAHEEESLSQEAVPANDNHDAANDNRPPLSFAERIARERQRHDQGPRLP